MNGGSHTNFNGGAFSAGAFSAAGALSAALGMGLMSFLNTQPEDFAGLDAEQLLALLVSSERFRGKEMQQWRATVDQLAEALKEIHRLTRDNAVLQAKAKLSA